MNYQAKAFQISILLHAAIAVLAIICGTFTGQYKKVMVLDFDLRKPVSEVKKIEPPPESFIETKAVPPVVRQSLKKKEPPRVPEEVSRKSSFPETPPIVKLPETHHPESSPMGMEIPDQGKTAKEGSPGISGGTNSGMGHTGGDRESAETKYLNDHFAYIRDRILRNVSYPDAARRMNWQGKVILSFVVTANGSVRECRVMKSSGFPMLDKNAMETVRDTAPFPRPPVEARLVIPIVYRLE